MINVLLTGSTGFVGSHLAKVISETDNLHLSVALRSYSNNPTYSVFTTGCLTKNTDWSAALASQQVVIHAAARAHIMKDGVVDSLAEYRKVNVDGTLNLAHQAVAAGVKRFIFISSIKVNGEQTPLGAPFTADDIPAPEDDYGLSKLEAEQGLQVIAKETGLELVIIRPSLVYGLGAKGNFANMNKLVAKGLPLPLGAVHNKRSLVALDNLVDLIITCIHHPAAANQIFLASDGEDISTSNLLRGVAKAMGCSSRLFPVPSVLLQLGATLLGKKAVASRLLGSLQVDITKTCEVLDWQPPLTVEQGLAKCFVAEKN